MMNDWGMIDAYFRENPYHISKHHLDTFDSFISRDVELVISKMNPITLFKYDEKNKLKHKIEVYVGGQKNDRIFLEKPGITRAGDTRPMFPNDARINDMTYAASLKADVDVLNYYYEKPEPPTRLKDVSIGRIPIMLHSSSCILHDKPPELLREMGECIYDQGGYFIVDGKEKVIVSQERNITNQIFATVSSDEKYSYTAFIRSVTESESVFPMKTVFWVDKKTNNIVVEIPHLKYKVPLFMLFRALGVEDDKSILQHIVQSQDLETQENALLINFLYPSITDGKIVYTKEEALTFLKEFTEYKTPENVEYILWKNLFPNISGEDDKGNIVHAQKALFLGHVVHKLIRVCLEIDPPTDRDNYMYKRLAVSGFLFTEIFKDFYNRFRLHVLNKMSNMYDYGNWKQKGVLERTVTDQNRHEVFIHKIIDDGFTTSLKGQWGLKKLQTGIVQDLERFNFTSYVSHMKTATSPMDPSIPRLAPHQLNTSQHGSMCPIQSPDGEKIGLVKTMTMSCHVTPFRSSKQVLDVIMPLFGKNIQMLKQIGHINDWWIKIMINNTWIGCLTDDKLAPEFMEVLHLFKRNDIIDRYVSLAWNIPAKEIYILTEHGRTSRPVFTVDPGNVLRIKNRSHHVGQFYKAVLGDNKKSWQELTALPREKMIKELHKTAGSVEFIDVQQTNFSMIAMYPRDLDTRSKVFSHCEIHPCLMFSPYTSMIPFANHNHSPRNVFSAGQAKWSIGRYATSYPFRIDTLSYNLHYPQCRLVQTRFSKHMHDNEMPIGENLMVAIGCFTGYNQEDSVILNKSAVERGMFNITRFKSYKSEEEENENVKVLFGNPWVTMSTIGEDMEIKGYGNYETLDENGFPKENVYLQDKDAIIGKIKMVENQMESTVNKMGEKEIKVKYSSKTEFMDKTMDGYVDKVYVRQNYSTGLRNAKIRLRKMKVPELGDKVASTHGQKGVCGLIVPQESMPFNKDGLTPDIIINPHAFPTRMTIGHLLEAIVAKSAVYEGSIADATPFEDISFQKFQDTLEKNSVEKNGLEIMYDGSTGQQMQAEIFLTPTYYYRLKHMVSDKINYRDKGKVDGLTQQPTQGRSNNGGLRVGEMEVNALSAHGLSGFVKESLMDRSDGKKFYVDEQTKSIVGINPDQKIYNDVRSWSSVEMPNAFKLMLQEIQMMGINVKIE